MMLALYSKGLLRRCDCVLLTGVPVNRAMTRYRCTRSQLRAGLTRANYPFIELQDVVERSSLSWSTLLPHQMVCRELDNEREEIELRAW